MSSTPWIGLAALLAMFIIPFLPEWLFEGPRTIKHRPRRHICSDCGAPWTNAHACMLEVDESFPPLRGELRRLEPPRAVIINKGSSEIVQPLSIPLKRGSCD
jgi:hypothetical protein